MKNTSQPPFSAAAAAAGSCKQQQPPPPPRQERTKMEKTPTVTVSVTEDVNESAEAFIKRFRNQLLIQRLQSIENYEKILAGET
ncbi:hypothetical protein SDJN02_24302, partial [Cucurbita argyrosperma subsp. argyrosperma]